MDESPKKENWLRRLYAWTLKWADHPHGTKALFGFSFIESSFFPIPPDPLLMALCFGKPKKWAWFAFWCTVSSVLGGVLGYFIGAFFWDAVGAPIVDFYHGQETMEKVKAWYMEWGFWGILAAAITPIPYKIFTIASGLFGFNIWALIFASILGRGFRFFVVAGVIRLFGDKIKPFLEQYLELATVLLFIVGVLGFLTIKFLQ